MDTVLYNKLCNILDQYGFDGSVKEIKPITIGHINDTFVVEYDVDGKTVKYLLQWINRIGLKYYIIYYIMLYPFYYSLK